MRLVVPAMILALSPASFAQAPLADWSVVRALSAGDSLRLKLADGRVRGRLVSVDSNGLILRRGNGRDEPVRRQDVRRIRLRPKGSAPVWGVLAGAALGGSSAAVSDGSGPNGSGGGRVGVAALTTGLGWLIGTAVKTSKTITIYEVR